MTRIIVSPDCGNSPKNIFLRDFTIAFAKGNIKSVLGQVTGDVRWTVIGDWSIQGKEELVGALEPFMNDKPVELTILHVVTHGKAGAVNGTVKLKSGKVRAFCDVYEFSSARGDRVQEITSYVIDTA